MSMYQDACIYVLCGKHLYMYVWMHFYEEVDISKHI